MFLGNNSTLPPEAENVKWISLGDGKNYTYYQFSKMIRQIRLYILLYQHQFFDEYVETHKNEYRILDFPGSK
jgi:hypothetical protein